MKAIFTNKKMWLALLVFAGLAGVAWSQRGPILSWYYVRQLTYAYKDDRESWAKKVAELEEVAVPRLLEGLASPDAIVCANLQYPLLLMAKNWGLANPRGHALVERLYCQFDEFSPAGQEKVVLWLTCMLQEDGTKPLPPRLTKVVGEILIVAEKNSELRAASLLLAAELVDCVQPGQWVDVARAMAERGLKDQAVGSRVAALQLLLRVPMRKDKDLLERMIPFLRAAEPAVRKAAMLALASESDLVREESFLPLLHDDDAEVQYLCENVLRKRGLTDDDIELARMISAKNASTRLRVFYRLHRMPDLNLSEWLRQLSQDPSPAVRAAAVRAAGEHPHVDFSARLREMAAEDPSETVRQNAHYYLQHRARRAALD